MCMRKIISVHFAEKPKLPENYQEVTWQKLTEAVVAIQTSKSIRYSLEELYQAVENMCNHKMASTLYVNLTSKCFRMFTYFYVSVRNVHTHIYVHCTQL